MMRRRFALCLVLIPLPLLAVLAWMPESFALMRLAQVLLSALVLVGCLGLLPRRWVLPALAVLLVPGAVVALWPSSGPVSTSGYAARLHTYLGTPYVWGGEGLRGLDCSGLLRRAWITAALREGVAGRPDLLRRAALCWAFDASAAYLLAGAGGATAPTGVVGTIDALTPAHVEVGDLAITRNGVHCLAYAGDGVWISADPGVMRVIAVRAPDPSFSWFQAPVELVRWR